ncbi:FAD-binding oxidoreductase [Parasphingopyxis algicola]|uniref:FAD-binding oxidoreductase n=1 Tax=Parasphingopyxis algicola TaxID=2026624 RepID=UPI0015A18EAA|nr:FAD-binding oxidoreductase [Parasphingopyxis algicola]QLC26069.1 FAD-binding oxidoreductase [Parasphingopyxis algicola]
MATAPEPKDCLTQLTDAVGPGAIVTDVEECAFYAQDVYSLGPQPLAVFRPADTDMLARALAAIADSGVAIVPRGGGMSYTSGYVAPEAGALIVDMDGMNRILKVDETDMTVTVEAGCSWHKLYEELHPRGLRTPVWGTLSGIKAHIGGGMSQNGLFWGAANGTIAPSAISMEVVLADGTIVKTGTDFLRPFGPDLTGLFAADAGSFGVKAKITLPLMRDATAFAYGSFAFDTPARITAAMSQVAREGLASECFGFDPFLQAQRMKRDSLTKDAKQLIGMMKSQGGFWKGLKEGAKVVAAGRSFLDEATFSAHLICEGRHQSAVDADMRRVEEIVAEVGGTKAENTIPKVMRANPFPPVNSMVGPDGERWVPVHGVVRHSRALATIDAITALFESRGAEMEQLGVGAGYLVMTVGRAGFLIEPVFYWPDRMEELHRRSLEPDHLAKLKGFPANAESRALVGELRAGVIDIFGEMEGVHFQIGRTYPLAERSDPQAWKLLEAMKRAVDPDGRMNPGALGLG